MYHHILVPLDGSDITSGLVDQAVGYAKSIGAEVTFFHALKDYGATDAGALERTLDPEAFARRNVAEAQRILEPALAAGRAAGITCQTRWKIAEQPYVAIQAAAEECGCDLILIASHGTRGFNRLILGSQTNKIVAESFFPVLVVRVHS